MVGLVGVVGLVGKANVGKSTFFSAATMKAVDIAAFPFTTIDANRGIAYLRTPCVCKELGVKDDPVNSVCIDGVRLVPVDIIDCPGLIRGAHLGKGLGNKFLDEVRRADALIVVVDAAGATDDNGQPVQPGTHDPVEDVRMFEDEFDLWLLSILKKDWEKTARTANSAREPIERHLDEKLSGLGINRFQISEATFHLDLDPYNALMWSEMDLKIFATELRKVSKPLIVAANKADMEPSKDNVNILREAGYRVVPTCAEAELSLRRATVAGLISYIPGDSDFEINKSATLTKSQSKALELIKNRVFAKWGSTGIQEIINNSFFELLETIPVYPVEDAEKLTDHQGRVLPDCYLVPRGTTTKQFASLIHTELSESFIFAIDASTKKRLSDDHILDKNDIIQIVASKARR